jgi:hypothetical protein
MTTSSSIKTPNSVSSEPGARQSLNLEILTVAPKFKKAVLTELQKLEDKEALELKPYIRVYIEKLGGIHELFQKTTADLHNATINRIEDTVKSFTALFPDEPTVALAALPINEQGYGDGKAVYLSGH